MPKDEATIVARMDALVDIILDKYAPLPASSLGRLLSLLCHGVPQWRAQRAATLARTKRRLGHARVNSEDWYWPAPKRKLGHYALPLLWRDRVVGGGNLSVDDGSLKTSFGYSSGVEPRDPEFRLGLAAELERMRVLLELEG